MSFESLLRVLRIVAFPTRELTRYHPKKWVRALGEAGLYFPMLPWTLLWFIVLLVAGLVLWFVVSFVELIVEWWEDV